MRKGRCPPPSFGSLIPRGDAGFPSVKTHPREAHVMRIPGHLSLRGDDLARRPGVPCLVEFWMPPSPLGALTSYFSIVWPSSFRLIILDYGDRSSYPLTTTITRGGGKYVYFPFAGRGTKCMGRGSTLAAASRACLSCSLRWSRCRPPPLPSPRKIGESDYSARYMLHI